MWRVHKLRVGPLFIGLGTSPRGLPFKLVAAWRRQGREALTLIDWERA